MQLSNRVIPIIDDIGEWFEFNFGFKPKRQDILSFCIHGLSAYTDYMVEKRDAIARINEPFTTNVYIAKKDRQLLQKFIRQNKTSLRINLPKLVESLIVYRASILPVVRQYRTMKYQKPPNSEHSGGSLGESSFYW